MLAYIPTYCMGSASTPILDWTIAGLIRVQEGLWSNVFPWGDSHSSLLLQVILSEFQCLILPIITISIQFLILQEYSLRSESSDIGAKSNNFANG